ncbi:MAG: sulfatase-like hydrolase/transferase [Kiritimatiellae bacterium]|nr:sulfatase-like hydrolase/transferase [Kiritimatiellia bacterium]
MSLFRQLLVMVAFAGALTAPARPPDLIFIILDDMTRDKMCWTAEGRGRYLSPNLDRLASEGVVMANQHVSSPVCTPSRYACLTGRYASRSRAPQFRRLAERAGQTIVLWNTHIVPGDVTLPKLLRDAGYRTGFAGKNHVIAAPPRPPIPADADPRAPQIADALRQHDEQLRAAIRAAGFDFAGGVYPGNPDDLMPRALRVHNMDWVTAAALEFLDTAPADRPVFLYFAPTLCHSPYEPHRSWRADPHATPAGWLPTPPAVLPTRETLPRRLAAAGRQRPHGEMVLWLDDAIGAILSRLEQLRRLDHSIIFVFNDNGQEGKGSIYQTGTLSPSLVWRHGGFPCGGVCSAMVSNIDFAPTLLDFAGARVPSGAFDGVSFRAALESPGRWLRDALYFELGFTRGVRMGNWKYIALRYPPAPEELVDMRKAAEYAPIHPIIQKKAPPPLPPYGHIAGNNNEFKTLKRQPAYFERDQLYDLSCDPEEQTNLAARAEFAKRVALMKERLSAFLRELPDGFAELSPPSAPGSAGGTP